MQITEHQKDNIVNKTTNELFGKEEYEIKTCKIRGVAFRIMTFVFAALAILLDWLSSIWIMPTILSQLSVGFCTGFFVVTIQEMVKLKELIAKQAIKAEISEKVKKELDKQIVILDKN